MSEAQECLKKSHVALKYVPPLKPEVPLDCTKVLFTKYPDITFPDPDDVWDLEVLCATPTLKGAGGILLLLQVTTYVKWEISFINTQGKLVREWHRVLVCMPMMYTIPGPRIALNMRAPWQLKLASYWQTIYTALKKVEELETVMAKILSLKGKGFCPKDIKALETALKELESKLNAELYRAAHAPPDNLALRMDLNIPNTGRFAGRVA